MSLPVTFENVVRSVALTFGHVPSPDEIRWVLWERTGYPEFFMGDPRTECAEQVKRHYELAQYGFQPCACCGREAVAFVCEPCDRLRVMDVDLGSYVSVGHSPEEKRHG